MLIKIAALCKPLISTVAPALLSLLALICLVVAAFLAYGLPLGLCAVAAACLLGEWRMRDEPHPRGDRR